MHSKIVRRAAKLKRTQCSIYSMDIYIYLKVWCVCIRISDRVFVVQSFLSVWTDLFLLLSSVYFFRSRCFVFVCAQRDLFLHILLYIYFFFRASRFIFSFFPVGLFIQHQWPILPFKVLLIFGMHSLAHFFIYCMKWFLFSVIRSCNTYKVTISKYEKYNL